MEIKVFDTYREISIYASFVMISLVQEKPDAVLGLATGSSPLGLYQEMVSDHAINKTSYKNITTFNLDEYYGINRNHSESYYHFMEANLFRHLDLDTNRIHIPNGINGDINEECRRYNDDLQKHPVDIQVLGIGRNGHIGFNEPGTSFLSETHYVTLDEKTRSDNARFFNSIDEVPKHAITMGIKNIMAAKKIILLAAGPAKADAISAMVQGNITENCPASVLQMHDHALILLDRAAASKIL